MPFKYNPFTSNLDEVVEINSATVIGPGSSTDDALVRWDGATGTVVQNSNATLTDAGTLTLADPLDVTSGGTGDSTAAGARTNLGLGSIATQDSSSVSVTGGSVTGVTLSSSNATITGGSVTGITDITVADGGTGRSTATAYAVVTGGTTATDPLQSIASVGTSGQVLTSNGAAALPTFEDAAAGGSIILPAYKATSQYYGSRFSGSSATTQPALANQIYINYIYFPWDCTLDSARFNVSAAAAAGNYARMGIYNLTSDGQFGTVLTTVGTVLVDSIGDKTIAFSQSLSAGYYAVAIHFEATTTVNAVFYPLDGIFYYTTTTTATPSIPYFNSTYASGLPNLTGVAAAGFVAVKAVNLQFRVAS